MLKMFLSVILFMELYQKIKSAVQINRNRALGQFWKVVKLVAHYFNHEMLKLLKQILNLNQ